MTDELRAAAALMQRQSAGVDPAPWAPEDWEARKSALLELIRSEESALRLGDVLRLDVGLDMPVAVVRATYLRLFELGASDAHTRLCYARYLLLHGPEWDAEAEAILQEIEAAARASGLWDSAVLGQHPVFYAGAD